MPALNANGNVSPTPEMKTQMVKIGPLKCFKSLNCGWYCLRALIEHHYVRLRRMPMRSCGVRKSTLLAFDPAFDVPKNRAAGTNYLVSADANPHAMPNWRALLEEHGPIIIGLERHFILLVGISPNNTQVHYKDPMNLDNLVLLEAVASFNRRVRNYEFVRARDAAAFIAHVGAHGGQE
jgi:hypothetical protein